MTKEPLVSVRNLKKYYPLRKGFISRQVGVAKAVDDISFDIYPGETVGLVGESGCGKSTAAESIIHLEPPTDGQVIFNSREWDPADAKRRSLRDRLRGGTRGDAENGAHPNDVTTFDKGQLRAFRRQAQMVMQDPGSSFNPRMTVGQAIAEMLQVHGMNDPTQRREIVQDLLERVGLSRTDYDRFPHEFSGGQKQRIGLARALVLNPELIIADEPVSALDVSIKAEILSLIDDLQEEFGLAVLFISHDLSVVREICDRVAVMYLGQIVEMGATERLFSDPQHPYTEALLSSIPTPDPRDEIEGIELTGEVPSPEAPPPGCRFHTRCHRVIQPDTEIPQADWRALVDLLIDLEHAVVDPEAVRESAVSMSSEIDDPSAVTRAQFGDRLREEYDIPARLGADRLDETLEATIDALFAGGTDDARMEAYETLASVVTTPCRAVDPAPIEEGDHLTKCHLHQPDLREAVAADGSGSRS